MWIVREAKLSDLSALLELEQCVVDAERPFNPSIKTDKAHYYDLNHLISSKDSHLIVVESANTIIATGYAQIRPSKASLKHAKHSYLGFMYVSPEYRGHGINQKVMDSLIAWSRNQGVADFYLDVYYQNDSAIKAYQKAGFEPSIIEMKLSTAGAHNKNSR